VDEAIHDAGDGNPHFHAKATCRPIEKDGSWGAKERKVYALDENGEKIPILDENGNQKRGQRGRRLWKRVKVEAAPWEGDGLYNEGKYDEWRERWAAICNEKLAEIGSEERLDHRSYIEQGINKIPTRHEGYVARQIEAGGGVSERCEYNRTVGQINALVEEYDRRRVVEAVDELIASLSPAIIEREHTLVIETPAPTVKETDKPSETEAPAPVSIHAEPPPIYFENEDEMRKYLAAKRFQMGFDVDKISDILSSGETLQGILSIVKDEVELFDGIILPEKPAGAYPIVKDLENLQKRDGEWETMAIEILEKAEKTTEVTSTPVPKPTFGGHGDR
jgi:hypothetical protein